MTITKCYFHCSSKIGLDMFDIFKAYMVTDNNLSFLSLKVFLNTSEFKIRYLIGKIIRGTIER